MDRATYSEAQLVQNRVSVLLSGGTAAEQKAWAEEAAARLGRSLTVVNGPAQLAGALMLKEGVVLIEDVLALGEPAQQQLVRCLQTQEERPKLVVVLQRGGEASLGGEGLRPDLHYALRLAQLNLEAPGLREAQRARRAAALAPSPSRPRASAARTPSPRRAAKKAGQRHKPRRPAAKKRSRR